jgi:hypothetical protein
MKSGHNSLDTPSVPPKKNPGEQNMKTRHDALSIVETESGSAKHENGY